MKVVKLIKGLHVTATEKRHMRQYLEKGFQQGETAGTKIKNYTLIKRDENGHYHFRIVTREKNMWGKMDPRSRIEVVYIGSQSPKKPTAVNPKMQQMSFI